MSAIVVTRCSHCPLSVIFASSFRLYYASTLSSAPPPLDSFPPLLSAPPSLRSGCASDKEDLPKRTLAATHDDQINNGDEEV